MLTCPYILLHTRSMRRNETLFTFKTMSRSLLWDLENNIKIKFKPYNLESAKWTGSNLLGQSMVNYSKPPATSATLCSGQALHSSLMFSDYESVNEMCKMKALFRCCAQFWPLPDHYPPCIGRFRVRCGGGVMIRGWVRFRQPGRDFNEKG